MILQKKFLRSDRIWTHPIAFKSFLARIPVYFDLRVLLRSQYWPRNMLEKYQEERMRSLLSDAQKIPYWRDVFAKAGINSSMSPRESLARLPILSKQTWRDLPMEYIADVSQAKRAEADHTSGSTGKPFHFYFDWHSTLRCWALSERIFRTATGGKRYPLVYMRARTKNGCTPYKHVWLFMRGHHAVKNRMDELKKIAQKFSKGFILYGYTSAVLEAVRQSESLGLRLPLKAVMATGESLGESDRVYMEKTTGAEFFSVYASRESGYLGFQCEKHAMHFCEEWAYLEIVDDAGRALPDGEEGRIVVTMFENRMMPFIRYEMGDRGVVSKEKCSCGRTLKTISFRGRSSDLIEFEDGRSVSVLDMCVLIDRYWNAVRQFQIIHSGKNSIVMKIVPGPEFSAQKRELELLLVGLLHPRIEITWEMVDSIPEAKSGKAVYFVKDFNYKS